MAALKLLRLLGQLHIAAGLLLTLTAFFPDAQTTIANAASLSLDESHSRFLFAVLGPTIASWGVLFTAVVTAFQDRASPSLWRAMLWSILIWAPLDSGLCLWFGIYAGAIVNGAVLIVFLYLIFRVRAHIDGG